RIEMARTLLPEDPEGAAELLLDVIEISRERPMEQIVGKWDLAARKLAEKDVGLSRTLTSWKKQWKIQQDERTRRFWER
nr:hypothetical protein [Micromonospora sp. DSM 115978]